VRLRVPPKALDLVSVALVALGLVPPVGAAALGPALVAVAAQALVRRRQGRALLAAAISFSGLAGALWSTHAGQHEHVSLALTFGALVSLLVAVVFGPSRGSAAAAALAAACRRQSRLAARAPAPRATRRLRTQG